MSLHICLHDSPHMLTCASLHDRTTFATCSHGSCQMNAGCCNVASSHIILLSGVRPVLRPRCLDLVCLYDVSYVTTLTATIMFHKRKLVIQSRCLHDDDTQQSQGFSFYLVVVGLGPYMLYLHAIPICMYIPLCIWFHQSVVVQQGPYNFRAIYPQLRRSLHG